MSSAIAIRQAVSHPNVAAFRHLIRRGEARDRDDDFTIMYGGAHFAVPPWAHPYHGQSTTSVGHSTACGAYQFLGTTWARLNQSYPEDCADFSPPAQEFGATALIAGRGALEDLMAGRFAAAVAKLVQEWTSLPGAAETRWTMDKARAYYVAMGGVDLDQGASEPTSPPVATAQPSPPPVVAPSQGGKAMDPLSLIGIFGNVLSVLIPQIGTLFGGKKDQQNVQAIGTVLDTIVKATGQTGPADIGTVGTAIAKMQADKALTASVTQAVVTHPEIIGLLEVGGGIKAARDYGIVVQQQEKPYWQNPTFIVTALFFPMMYMIVAAVLFTVYTDPSSAKEVMEAFKELPFYAKVGFDQATRSGLVNLIVGMVIGGVVGVWFGTSYGSQRKTELATTATQQAVESSDKG